jgi:hypothetical protein
VETVEVEKKEDESKSYQKTNVDKQFLKNVVSSVSQNVMDELIASKNYPNNSSTFEKNCQAFKKNNDQLFFYIKVNLHIFSQFLWKTMCKYLAKRKSWPII